MTEKGTFYLKPSDFGKKFVIVFVIPPGDAPEECYASEAKRFTVKLEELDPLSSYTAAIAFILVVYFGVPYGLAYGLISIEFFRKRGFNEVAYERTDAGQLVAKQLPFQLAKETEERWRLAKATAASYGATNTPSSGSVRAMRPLRRALSESVDWDGDADVQPATPSGTPLPTPVAASANGPSVSLWLREWNNRQNYTPAHDAFFRGQPKLFVNFLTRKLPSTQVCAPVPFLLVVFHAFARRQLAITCRAVGCLVQERKFNQYALMLLVIIVFYGLPVIQYVGTSGRHRDVCACVCVCVFESSGNRCSLA
jgi:hypothetical protein